MTKPTLITKKIRSAASKREAIWLVRQTRKIILSLLLMTAVSAVTSALGAVFVLVSKSVIDTASAADPQSLMTRCVLLFAVVIVRLALSSLASIQASKASIKMGSDIKTRLFEALLRKEWLRVNAFHSGDLVARFSSDLEHVVNGIIQLVPELVSLVTQLACSLYVLLKLDAAFACIAFATGPAVVVAGRLFSRRIKDLHSECQETDAEARSFLQESIQNMLMIKAFSKEKRSIARLRQAVGKNNRLRIRKHKLGLMSGIGLSVGYWIGYVLAIIWGSYRLGAGYITFGTMAAFLQLVNQVQAPFIGLTKVFPRIYTTFASAGRLIEIEDIPDEPPASETVPVKQVKPVSLTMKGVYFSYDDDPVLCGADLEAEGGEFIVLAGSSGSGKTTVLRLLLSLLEPDAGEIYIECSNGTRVPVDTCTRKYFSYVPQGNMLFSGTIEENIRYGDPGTTFDKVVACARIACIHDFISALPDKYRTVIGERGLGLSEGQAQRIAIARALLRDAPILLLDEATSAIDEATEAILVKNLKTALHDRICIFISHRHTMSDSCDRGYVLQNGRLVCTKSARSARPGARAGLYGTLF